MPVLPAVRSLVAAAPAVAFSGSRSPSPVALAACGAALAAVPAAVPVLVGCAAGVDQHIRSGRPGAQVFRAAAFGGVVPRSVACVRACVAAGGLWVAFPAGGCPVGVVPSSSSAAAFCGSGSGSWASLAFAVGSGAAALVWLPAPLAPPAAFGLAALGRGWWHRAAPAVQLGLF